MWSGLLPRLLSKVLVLEVVKVSRRGCGGWSCCRPRSLLTVKSVLLSVNNSNIDVSGKRGNRLSLPIVGDNLGNSPVTGSVPVQDCLRSSIPGCTDRSWAAIAAVSGLPEVAEAGGIRLPGAVHCAERVDILQHTVTLPCYTNADPPVTFPVVQSKVHLVLMNPWAQ